MWLVVVLGVLWSCAAASAYTNVTVRSTARARVYLDGEYKGVTPVSLYGIAPGAHELEVQEIGGGRYEVYELVSSPDEDVDRTYFIDFSGEASVRERVVRRRRLRVAAVSAGTRAPAVVRREVVVEEPVVVQRPVYVPVYRPSYGTSSSVRVVHEPSRSKVRMRNALLTAAVMNEIFNDNARRRKKIRKGAIAATILNEIFSK